MPDPRRCLTEGIRELSLPGNQLWEVPANLSSDCAGAARAIAGHRFQACSEDITLQCHVYRRFVTQSRAGVSLGTHLLSRRNPHSQLPLYSFPLRSQTAPPLSGKVHHPAPSSPRSRWMELILPSAISAQSFSSPQESWSSRISRQRVRRPASHPAAPSANCALGVFSW